MKKRTIIVGGSVLLILVIVICISPLVQKNKTKNFSKAPTNVSVEAKIDEYQSLESIENKVDIIVKVIKESEDAPIIWRNELGSIYFVGTIGKVRITEIHKDESGRHLESDGIIPIFENEAYDAESNVTYHVADYKKMDIGKEYMLFLNYSDGDDWYVPCSAIWGKYPLENTEPILYNGADTRSTTTSTDSAIGQIGLEVIEKYK